MIRINIYIKMIYDDIIRSARAQYNIILFPYNYVTSTDVGYKLLIICARIINLRSDY